MRKSVVIGISAASALVAAMSAFAAADYYLKLGDIKGESTERAAQGAVEVSSFAWGVNQAAASRTGSGGGAGKASMQDLSVTSTAAPRDAASGMPTGKRQHKPMTFATDDQSSPSGDASVRTLNVALPVADNATTQALDRACAKGEHIKSAELGNGRERYQLSDVVVSSCAVAGNERKYELRGHVTLIK
jgi:type VI protein secretion system component Hcp